MGVFELLLWIVVICIVGSLAIYARRALAPNMLPQADMIIGVVCLIIIVLLVLKAFGVIPHDPKVPQLR